MMSNFITTLYILNLEPPKYNWAQVTILRYTFLNQLTRTLHLHNVLRHTSVSQAANSTVYRCSYLSAFFFFFIRNLLKILLFSHFTLHIVNSLPIVFVCSVYCIFYHLGYRGFLQRTSHSHFRFEIWISYPAIRCLLIYCSLSQDVMYVNHFHFCQLQV